MTPEKLVVLAHGFSRSSSDMSFLESYLSQKGYITYSAKLSTVYGTLDDCVQELKQQIDERAKHNTLIFLVGHSMGGLIIRKYLSQNIRPNIVRCVLIATPNSGTKLANLAVSILRRLSIRDVIQSLNCLETNNQAILAPLNEPPPDIGVIAGNKGNFLLGKLFLPAENDGRVEVESVKFSGM